MKQEGDGEEVLSPQDAVRRRLMTLGKRVALKEEEREAEVSGPSQLERAPSSGPLVPPGKRPRKHVKNSSVSEIESSPGARLLSLGDNKTDSDELGDGEAAVPKNPCSGCLRTAGVDFSFVSEKRLPIRVDIHVRYSWPLVSRSF